MLDNIQISRFRSIHNLRVDHLEQFNLFVGANDAGKSSVLEAIFLIMNPGGGQLPVNINFFRGISTDVKDFFALNFYNLDVSKAIRISARFNNLQHERSMVIQLSDNHNFDSEKPDIFSIDKLTENTSPHIDELSSTFEIQYEVNEAKKILGRTYMRQRGNSIEIKANLNIDVSKKGIYIRSGFEQREVVQWVNEAMLEKHLPKIIKVLNLIEPDLTQIVISPASTIYCDVGLDRMVPIGNLGDGILKALYILSVISIHKNGYVIIDEIENGLHHQSLNKLWNAIVAFSRDNKAQIFASTHSMDCVRAFIDSDIRGEALEGQKKIYRVQRVEGETKIFSYDYDVAQVTIERDMELR